MSEPPTPVDAFAAALQRCSASGLEAFVIDLLEARGWAVEAGPDRVRFSKRAPSGPTRALAIDPPSDPDATDSDGDHIVVTPARQSRSTTGDRVDTLTADDLHRMLRFAVDRPTAEGLVGDHLDVPPDAVLRPAASPAADGGASWGRPGRPRPEAPEPAAAPAVGSTLGAALVLVLVVMVAIGAASGYVDTVDALADPVVEPALQNPSVAQADGTSSGSPGAGERLADQPRYLEATPTCDRPPGLVVALIVGALGAAGPNRTAGIDAAWRFSIPIGSEPGFERLLGRPAFDLLFDHETAAYGPVLDHGGDVVSQRVRLSSPTVTRSYRFFLTRQGFGDRAACWFLAGVLVDDADTSRSAF